MNDLKASKEMLIDELTRDPSVENIAKALCYLLRTCVTEEEATQLHNELCSECRAHHVSPCSCTSTEQKPKDSVKHEFIAKLLSPMFMLFVITILSLMTAMYCMMGDHGFKTVTNSASRALQPYSSPVQTE